MALGCACRLCWSVNKQAATPAWPRSSPLGSQVHCVLFFFHTGCINIITLHAAVWDAAAACGEMEEIEDVCVQVLGQTEIRPHQITPILYARAEHFV